MEQFVRSSLLAIGAQFLRKRTRQQNESRTSTPVNESAAPAPGPLLDPDTGEFTGSDDALIERCSLQGLLVRYRGRWQRRIVQTITFEDAQTHRRSMSIDVSGARLAVILDEWDIGRAPLYLPVSTGMLPGPILDIDARDGRGATLSIARRYENNEATTYQLLAVLIGRAPLRPGRRPAAHDSWVKVAAKTIYQYLKHWEKTPETVAKEFEQIEGMPDDIKNFAMSADFLNELDYLKHYYTLHVVYTPPRDDEHRVRDDVLKISWLERAARTRLGIGDALRSVFVPGPWPYAIDLPLLTGSKHGGTHIRLIAPEDLEIGRLALAFGDQEIPLLPQSTGSASDSRPYTTPQTLSDDHSNPAVELTRNRRQAEILVHPRTLTDLENRIINKNKNNTSDSSQWVMTATFNPGHHRFLLPAAINLIATVALLCLAHHFSWGTASAPTPSTAFLSMIPPLVTMYFASPREHAIAGQFHAFGRMLVTLSAGIALLYAALETYDTSRTSMHCLPLGHPLNLCVGARTFFAIVISVCCLSILYLVVLMVSVNASHIDAFRLRKNLAAARNLLPEEQTKNGALRRRRRSLHRQGVISMIFMTLLVRRNFDAPPPRIR